MRFVLALVMVMSLTGCSGLNLLSGLTDKPDVTAQVGTENTKQLVGATAKRDESTKQETTIKESNVERVDSSNRKQVKTATIQASEIKAESITVNGDPMDDLPVLAFSAMCIFVAGFLSGKLTSKKGA